MKNIYNTFHLYLEILSNCKNGDNLIVIEQNKKFAIQLKQKFGNLDNISICETMIKDSYEINSNL